MGNRKGYNTPSRYTNVNWHDKASVIAYAERLGKNCGQTVYKHPDRQNYNIVHTENEDRFMINPEWVVHRTGGIGAKGPQRPPLRKGRPSD